MPVYWLIAASESLRAAAHHWMNVEQKSFDSLKADIDAVLAAVFPGQVVLVRDRFTGYRDFDGLSILLAEVQPDPAATPQHGPFPSPGTYIVKVAFGAKLKDLEAELNAWDQARPPHLRSDNIFVSLDPFPPRQSGQAPSALVYGDAGMVLGLQNVVSLEEAVFRSCRYGQPRPQSIVRLLRALYERLGMHFFSRSDSIRPSQYLALAALPRLTDVLLRWREALTPSRPDPLADAPPIKPGANDANCRRVRREVLALLATDHEFYADPVDFLSGTWEDRASPQSMVPHVRRGFAHGDLHARNVQVAIVEDVADHCALFDYEKMHGNNFIAWDFIKMEVELAVRLLDMDAAQEWPTFVAQALTFWRYVAARTDEFDRHQRLANEDDLEDIDAHLLLSRDPRLAERVMGLPRSLLRLAEGIARLRRIAKSYLRGGFDWMLEYDFMMAWYAVRAGLYDNYDLRKISAALLAAGVSVRRLMRRQPSAPTPTRSIGETSHRSRFLHARKLARSGDPAERDAGILLLGEIRQDYPHVLEVEEELALGYIEQRDYAQAEALLHGIEPRYQHTTAETPARLGALWKRRATAVQPFDTAALRKSLDWYRRAEAIRGEYFPAINVASLLFLLGDKAAARKHAERVLTLLDKIEDPTADPFWPHATRGEALLLIDGEIAEAIRCYERAVAERDCTPRDRRSMRLQLELLRPLFDGPKQAALNDAGLGRVFGA